MAMGVMGTILKTGALLFIVGIIGSLTIGYFAIQRSTERDQARMVQLRQMGVYPELVVQAGQLSQEQLDKRIVALLKSSTEKDLVDGVTLYLEDNALQHPDNDKLDINYFLFLSDAAMIRASAEEVRWKKNDFHRKAVQSLMTFEALAMTDGMRCEDESAWEAFSLNVLSERTKALQDAYKYVYKNQYKGMMDNSIGFEIAHGARPFNPDICRMGSHANVAVLSQSGTQTIQKDDPTYVGGKVTEIVAPPDYKYEPKYVDSDIWLQRRGIARQNLRKIWSDRYADQSKG